MGKKRGVERGSCGLKRITFFSPLLLPLFVLLSGFLNVSQSKSSRRKAGQYNVTADGKTARRKRKRKDKKSARKETKRGGGKVGWGK